MQRKAFLTAGIALVALASAGASVACARPSPAPASTPASAARAPEPATAPTQASSCAVAGDCGPGLTCRFDTAGCDPAPRGSCIAPEPPCAVAYPFCACDGRTVYACSHPATPYHGGGACGAPVPSDGKDGQRAPGR